MSDDKHEKDVKKELVNAGVDVQPTEDEEKPKKSRIFSDPIVEVWR